jgi:hypothetical protein
LAAALVGLFLGTAVSPSDPERAAVEVENPRSPGSDTPTFGGIPKEAFLTSGVDVSLLPDFVELADQKGGIAGYVRAKDLFREEFGLPPLKGDGRYPVFDADGEQFGMHVPGVGLVTDGVVVGPHPPPTTIEVEG